MDILISSNLERLIYLMCGEDTERVAGWMKSLSENGRYEVGEEMKARLHEEFFAACATDEETMRAIAEAWRENRYLIDPHTAVARHVLEARPADGVARVCLSTASPYKFAYDVCCALGTVPDGDDPAVILSTLERISNTKAPAPLTATLTMPLRFKDTVDPADMAKYILEH